MKDSRSDTQGEVLTKSTPVVFQLSQSSPASTSRSETHAPRVHGIALKGALASELLIGPWSCATVWRQAPGPILTQNHCRNPGARQH